MKTLSSLLLIALFTLLGACASQPERSDALLSAREAVTAAEEDPAVSRFAPLALKDAQDTLRAAERIWREDGDPQQVDHLAYLTERKAAIAMAHTRREEVAQAVEQAERERGQLRLQAREDEIAQARRELEEARRQLADLEPKQTERGLVLTLGEVLFAFDSTELQPGGERTLARLADYLQANPDYQILIEGHTDSVGDAQYNRGLSERRAQTVRNALTAKGIDSSRVTFAGLGENYPVAPNSTAAGRSENRRVEVVIARDEMPPSREQGARPALARERGAPAAQG